MGIFLESPDLIENLLSRMPPDDEHEEGEETEEEGETDSEVDEQERLLAEEEEEEEDEEDLQDLPLGAQLDEGFGGTPPNAGLFPPGPDTTGAHNQSSDRSFDTGEFVLPEDAGAQFDGRPDELFDPQKLINFPHTVRSHSNESLDALEQMLYANVYNKGLSGALRKKLAWQLNLAVRQSATGDEWQPKTHSPAVGSARPSNNVVRSSLPSV